MRYPTLFATLLAPIAASAHDGPHLHPHGAEPALAGLGLLAVLAVAGAALFRGRK
jgi:hypothetical protein